MDVNAVNSYGNTPLALAVRAAVGAAVADRDAVDSTAFARCSSVVDHLLAAAADPYRPNALGDLPCDVVLGAARMEVGARNVLLNKLQMTRLECVELRRRRVAATPATLLCDGVVLLHSYYYSCSNSSSPTPRASLRYRNGAISLVPPPLARLESAPSSAPDVRKVKARDSWMYNWQAHVAPGRLGEEWDRPAARLESAKRRLRTNARDDFKGTPNPLEAEMRMAAFGTPPPVTPIRGGSATARRPRTAGAAAGSPAWGFGGSGGSTSPVARKLALGASASTPQLRRPRTAGGSSGPAATIAERQKAIQVERREQRRAVEADERASRRERLRTRPPDPGGAPTNMMSERVAKSKGLLDDRVVKAVCIDLDHGRGAHRGRLPPKGGGLKARLAKGAARDRYRPGTPSAKQRRRPGTAPPAASRGAHSARDEDWAQRVGSMTLYAA